MVPALFHVSDAGPMASMTPRPSPPGSPQEGRPLVWAIDDVHLPNYLLPRDCPRVCWVPPPERGGCLSSPAERVIAIEHRWLPALADAGLAVHRLDPKGFTLIDAAAGYWVAERDVAVRDVTIVEDCAAALAERGVELRVVTSLRRYVEAVVAHALDFSVIRFRETDDRGQ